MPRYVTVERDFMQSEKNMKNIFVLLIVTLLYIKFIFFVSISFVFF